MVDINLSEEVKKTDYTTGKLKALYEKDKWFFDLYVHLQKIGSIWGRRMSYVFPESYEVDEEDWPEEWQRLSRFDILIEETSSVLLSKPLQQHEKIADIFKLFSRHELYEERLAQYNPSPFVFYEDDNMTPRTDLDHFEMFEAVILDTFKGFLEYIEEEKIFNS